MLVKCICGFEFYTFQKLSGKYCINCSKCKNQEAGSGSHFLEKFEIIISY